MQLRLSIRLYEDEHFDSASRACFYFGFIYNRAPWHFYVVNSKNLIKPRDGLSKKH